MVVVEQQLKLALRYRTKQYWENHYAAKAKVSDAVIILEEDIRCVYGPHCFHQQARPQRHHKPRRKILAKQQHNS